MKVPASLGIIAGNGAYPRLIADAARKAGVSKVSAAAFKDETDPALVDHVTNLTWLRVGQLGKLVGFFRDEGIHHAIMAGQIAPGNLFNLRPDWKALTILAKLKRRNAETIFGAIADELARNDVELLPATSFLEDHVAPSGIISGAKLSRREEEDIEFGWTVAKEIARLDIGQSVVVRRGTVIAVEGFDGTNATIKRGGLLAGAGAVLIKVAKSNQDMRFDVPVIGPETIRIAAEAKLRAIAVEAGRTLLLEAPVMAELAARAKLTIIGRAS